MPEDTDKPTDKPEAENEVVAIKDLEHVRGEHFVSLYSNFVQASYTPWDIRVNFSEITEVDVDRPAIMHVAMITLPPQVAKAMVMVLAKNIQSYENDNGPIKLSIGKPEAKIEGQPESDHVVDATDNPPAG